MTGYGGPMWSGATQRGESRLVPSDLRHAVVHPPRDGRARTVLNWGGPGPSCRQHQANDTELSRITGAFPSPCVHTLTYPALPYVVGCWMRVEYRHRQDGSWRALELYLDTTGADAAPAGHETATAVDISSAADAAAVTGLIQAACGTAWGTVDGNGPVGIRVERDAETLRFVGPDSGDPIFLWRYGPAALVLVTTGGVDPAEYLPVRCGPIVHLVEVATDFRAIASDTGL